VRYNIPTKYPASAARALQHLKWSTYRGAKQHNVHEPPSLSWRANVHRLALWQPQLCQPTKASQQHIDAGEQQQQRLPVPSSLQLMSRCGLPGSVTSFLTLLLWWLNTERAPVVRSCSRTSASPAQLASSGCDDVPACRATQGASVQYCMRWQCCNMTVLQCML
jgi:hypothetical protein